MSNTVQHFTHNHPLTEVNGVGTYTCDGCKLYGDSKTYRCSDCDYDLHEYCATCPQSLINSCHGPDHELSLYSGPTHMTERSCYICRVYIQGMFYKCKQCSFESHPLCTHVSMHVSSPDATKQRSLHDHSGQPSFPQHYGQGNPYPYGYAHMGPYVAYPYVAYPYGGHQYQHQHQHQHSSMNHGSPKADPKQGSSTPKKKKGGFLDGFTAVLGATAGVATNLLVASLTGSTLE
ncbi:Protein VACUOLELESS GAMETOPHYTES [Cardamine amara subsp. amara]|uniref:Protein VACUOLELESS GAMETOPHYTES n=1 Tax=Cardamine amara subsp. amara TaxID=228776 RepID=A0ABD1ATC8_CARAN